MKAQIFYHDIIEDSLVDGPGGPRTVLVMSGCSIRCPGCQNQHLWEFDQGKTMPPYDMAKLLVEKGNPVTISGGEPTDQTTALWMMLAHMRAMSPDLHVIIYTGHSLDDLCQIPPGGNLEKQTALSALFQADVVVDGPYRPEHDDDMVQWRGSRNQRPIDIAASLLEVKKHSTKFITDLPNFLVLEDWDIPVLMITGDGTIVGASGLVERILEGSGDATRRCGES